jgi:rSAM/selenodomain-associated transferase 1
MVFARVPRPGRVKTRLIPALGPAGAARVYRVLMRRALMAAARLSNVRRELWCADDPDLTRCATIARRLGMRLHVQPDGDLGARLSAAFARALESVGAGPAIVIGSDCPGYTPAYLEQAFGLLETGSPIPDAVIGPALDGGYVLIGLRRPAPSLFTGIPWSTDQVLELTREALAAAGLTWRELPPLADIDRPADLAGHPDLLAAAATPTPSE